MHFTRACIYPEHPIQHGSIHSAISHRLLSDFPIIPHFSIHYAFNLHNLGH